MDAASADAILLEDEAILVRKSSLTSYDPSVRMALFSLKELHFALQIGKANIKSWVWGESHSNKIGRHFSFTEPIFPLWG